MQQRSWRAALAGIVAFTVAAAGLNYLVNPNRPSADLTAEEDPYVLGVTEVLRRAVDQPVLWVDARPAEAFAAGTIPGAVNVPPGRFETGITALLERWTPSTTIVVFCDGSTCDASRELARKLRAEFELPEVYAMKGGWEAWSAANASK